MCFWYKDIQQDQYRVSKQTSTDRQTYKKEGIEEWWRKISLKSRVLSITCISIYENNEI